MVTLSLVGKNGRMDFRLPEDVVEYLAELDEFIESEIKPLEQQDDNIRFFDHRREDARTDWDRGGLPNEEWEQLLSRAKRLADAAGHYRYPLSEEYGGKKRHQLGHGHHSGTLRHHGLGAPQRPPERTLHRWEQCWATPDDCVRERGAESRVGGAPCRGRARVRIRNHRARSWL